MPAIEVEDIRKYVSEVINPMLDGIDPVIGMLLRDIDITLPAVHVTPVHTGGVHTGVTGTPPEQFQALILVKGPVLVEDIKSQKKVLV